MKNITFMIVGFILGTVISVAVAKYESGTNDAMSVVGYGYNGSTLVPILVDGDGLLQTE